MTDEAPPVLYHYCSMSTFESIVQKDEIWLSSLSVTNDSMEGRLVAQIFDNLAVRDEGCHAIQVAKTFLANLEHFHDCLGFCVSEAGDLLSQWRGYGDNGRGVAIGFSKHYFENLVSSDKRRVGNFRFDQVTYELSEQLKIVEPVYSSLKEAEAAALKSEEHAVSDAHETETSHDTISSFYWAVHVKVAALIRNLYLMKGDFFEEEREWRLTRQHQVGRREPSDFRLSAGALVPYTSVSLGAKESQPIREIILGPRNSSSWEVICDFLHSHGHPETTVKHSRGSYR